VKAQRQKHSGRIRLSNPAHAQFTLRPISKEKAVSVTTEQGGGAIWQLISLM